MSITPEQLAAWLEQQPDIVGFARNDSWPILMNRRGNRSPWTFRAVMKGRVDESPLARFLASLLGRPVMTFFQEPRWVDDWSVKGQLFELPAWLKAWDKSVNTSPVIARAACFQALHVVQSV